MAWSEIARLMYESAGHSISPPCQFSGCTCGAVEMQRIALGEYARKLQEVKSQGGANGKGEEG
jgi:hypothetical protein